MRKCILVLLILSGVAVAGDSVDAERAALREKLTLLAKVRKSLGLPQPQPALALMAIDKAAWKEKNQPAQPAAQPRARAHVVGVEKSQTPPPQAAMAGPRKPSSSAAAATDVAPRHEVIQSAAADEFQKVSAQQEVSLGEIARQNRARKRHKQQASSSQ